MRNLIWTVIGISLVAGSFFGQTALAQPDDSAEADSVYSRLETRRLLENMRLYGMNELQEAFLTSRAEGDTQEGRLRRAELLIHQATSEGVPLPERDRLLDEALAIMTAVYEDIPGDTAIELRDIYRLTFDRAWKTVGLRAGPYIDRLLTLQGGQADRDEVLAVTEEPVIAMQYLLQDVQDTIEEYSGVGVSAMDFMTIVPPLRDLLLEVRYRTGWAKVYRAMAMTDPANRDERTQMLEEALDHLATFSEGPDVYGVKIDATLMAARAYRLMGEPEAAIERLLDVVEADDAHPMTRVNALFEIPLAMEAKGEYQKALQATQEFHTKGMALIGQMDAMVIDFRVSLLAHFIFQSWAETTGGNEKATLELRGQQALLAFVEGHPDRGVRSAYYRVIATKYRHLEDTPDAATSLVLLAMADKAVGEAIDAKMIEDEEAVTEAMEEAQVYLDTALARSGDQMTERLRNELLDLKTLCDVVLGNKMDAARSALARAKELEDLGDPSAWETALLAVRLADEVVEGERQRGSVDPANRGFFIDAAEYMLSHVTWIEAHPELAQWYFDVGWHYQQLAAEAGMDRKAALYTAAASAYAQVPAEIDGEPNDRAFMEGQFRSLELRLYVLTKLRDPDNIDQNEAQTLRGNMKQFGNDAKLRSQRAAENGLGSFKTELDAWGSEMEFRAAELLYDPLKDARRAVNELTGLAERWPDDEDVLARGKELEIRVRIDDGQIEEAVEELLLFEKEHPDKAQLLISLVINQVRGSINEIRWDDLAKADREELQQNFFKLADMLFVRVKDQPLDQRYRQTQMYAEALFEVERAEEALKLFEECGSVGEGDRKAQTQAIDTAYYDRLTKLKEAEGGDDPMMAVDQMASDLRAELVEAGYGDDFEFIVEIDQARTEVAAAEGDEAKISGRRLVSRAVRTVSRFMWRRQLGSIPVDPTNLHGKARCLMALGLPGGMSILDDLISQIDKETYPDLYWGMQLERAWWALRAYDDDSKGLRYLIQGKIQLAFVSRGAMGGHIDEFNKIERLAKARLAELGDPWIDLPQEDD
jgi:hypothetical protein